MNNTMLTYWGEKRRIATELLEKCISDVRGQGMVGVHLITAAGYEVVSGPRTTGDGYYESCIVAIEGNQIEITK